jgi:putative lipoprotein
MIPSRSRRSILCLALILGALAAPVVGSAIPARFTNVITGTATYRERIALPPGASFEATLEEESPGGGPDRVIARVRERHPGQVPIDFELRYDSRRVDSRERYVVRASIVARGRPLFTGSQNYRMRSRGQSRPVTVVMRRAPGMPGDGGGGSSDELTNTRWRPFRIANRDIAVPERQREAWILLDSSSGRVTGSGGCNRISGSFESSSRGRLLFGPLIHTQMACPSIEVEAAFLRALSATRRYRIVNRRLELQDDLGRPLMQLEEASLR